MHTTMIPRGSSKRKCLICSATFKRPNSVLRKGHGLYCSVLCKRIAQGRLNIGVNNPNWKGGKTIIDGRPCLYMPEHPRATREGYVYEHIVIIENRIGRRLKWFGNGDKRNEVVHHKNRNKMDNSDDNLVMMPEFDHKSLHAKNRKKAMGEHVKC